MTSCSRFPVSLRFISLSLGLLLPGLVSALPFGIYEPRSMAMGGAGVAAASSTNAVFYNPAILATYRQYKEKGNNEAFSFPTLAIRASSAVETLADRKDARFEADITTAIDNYNNDPNTTTAQTALNAVSDLHDILGEVANNLLLVDGVASLAIGIPSKQQGGAFFVSHRGVADGILNVPADDLATLNDYQEALLYITSGGNAGVPHPDLFDENGELGYPTTGLTSSINARAAVITELGLSMSRQFNLLGENVAVGLSPKMVKVTTYEYQKTITSGAQDKEGTTDDNWFLNFDLGILKELSPRWRLGLVVKNLIERSYPTASGEKVTVKPQWRMGVAYLTSPITYTVDVDLQSNDGVYPGNSAQFLLAGIEIKHNVLRYRFGYRDSFAHKGPKEDGVFSAGLGLNIKPVYFDLAYSENHQQRAGSLMLGFNF